MYKTEEEQKLEDEANKYTYMNKIIDNLKIKQQNGRLWTPYHDMQLYEYVIKYNFNFYEISNAFQKLCTNDKKYEYSEDAVRLHWAFLHAMRHFDQTPDEAYYQRMKLQYDKEKPKTFKNSVEEKEKILSEEEDIRRMKEEFEKNQKEKEEKEKKIKEEKDKKEKERIEKEKKEDEKIEELINTTTTRKENNDTDGEGKDKNDKDKNENENNDIKEEKLKINNDNKLYDENNEPEFIKQLFSKNIPKDILDKLNKDQEKYNNINNNKVEDNKNIITEDKNINENNDNIDNNDNNKLVKQKEENEENNINTNLDINEEISKKEKNKIIENNKINIIEDEEDLFPIKSNKQKELSEPGKFENVNMEQELRGTQDFNDYIQNNPELKKQYDQLNNYCNFAVKSINYIVNKGVGVNNTSESEAKKIENANRKLNEFLLEPIIKKTEEEGFTIEDWNKKIEEEEHKMNFETTNYDNYMKNAPKDEERDMKLNKFKEHLFGFAEKISTEELLEKITGIIGQNLNENNNNEENNNQIIENENNNINNINNINNNNNNNINNNINLENRIQNFMNNLENNNVEDEKSENTKEQSESVNDNAEDNGRNTISSVGSLEVPRKYRHVYRGMVYYNDKPDENDKRNKNNNRNNNNKKKINEDDEIEEDDDEDDDEYNK